MERDADSKEEAKQSKKDERSRAAGHSPSCAATAKLAVGGELQNLRLITARRAMQAIHLQ
eukprot:1160398-Pelagomonas_calceolata.AAC.3